jgi:hypothetical protein
MARAAAGAVAQAGINEKALFRRSVDITLPNFRRVICEPILDLSPVAREHPCNVTDRHSVMLAQVNRVQPYLPGGFLFVGFFVVHFSTRRLGPRSTAGSPAHPPPTCLGAYAVGGNHDFVLGCRSSFYDYTATINPCRLKAVVRDDQESGLFCWPCFGRCRRGGVRRSSLSRGTDRCPRFPLFGNNFESE